MQDWAARLKKEYADGKGLLEKYRESLRRRKSDALAASEEAVEALRQELRIVEDMIGDMDYSIEWLQLGRRPDGRRGVDIHDAYSRSIMMDMDLLPYVQQVQEPERDSAVTPERKAAIVGILLKLSDRERQCYLLHMAQGMSFSDIGRELKLKKRTVQDYVDRAKSKVAQAI